MQTRLLQAIELLNQAITEDKHQEEQKALDGVMDIKELCEYLHISKVKAYELCKAPGFPSTLLFGKYIISKPLLEQWIQTKCKGEC